MAYFSSNAPAPESGGGAQPQPQPSLPQQPGPAIVPAKEPGPGKKKWLLWLIALVVAGGLGYYYWNATSARTAGGGGPVNVPTAVASTGSVVSAIRVNGTIAAANRQNIMAPRIQGSRSDANRGGMGGGGGRGGGSSSGASTAQAVSMAMLGGGGGLQSDFQLILMKLATPGQVVKAGDIIAEFDPQMQIQRRDDYEDNLIQVDAQLKSSTASMASQKEQNAQQLRSAKASWDQALQDLKKQPVSSDIDSQLLKVAVDQAEATYKQYLETNDLQDQQQQSQIRQTELTMQQTQTEFERTKANVEKMKIRAPMDGVVVMGSIVRNGEMATIRIGDEVRAGQPFMYIVDPRAMILNASVNQVDAEKLRLGMKATVRLDAYNDIEVPATLDGIGAMSTTSTFRAGYVGSIPVRVKLDKMDARIIPDLTGSAEVYLQREESAIVVPRAAVFEENGSKFVFAKTQQGWVRRNVETGVANNTSIAIRSGLQKGEVVALERPI